MKTASTFSVILICRPDKKNIAEGFIYARITVNGEPTEISLKEKIPVSLWNADKQAINGRTPQIKALNTHLDNVIFRIKEKYRSFIDNGFQVTAQGIKEAYLSIQSAPKGHTLFELISYHTKIWGENLSPGTMKNYGAAQEYASKYIQYKFKREDVFLSELNFEFIIKLESYK